MRYQWASLGVEKVGGTLLVAVFAMQGCATPIGREPRRKIAEEEMVSPLVDCRKYGTDEEKRFCALVESDMLQAFGILVNDRVLKERLAASEPAAHSPRTEEHPSSSIGLRGGFTRRALPGALSFLGGHLALASVLAPAILHSAKGGDESFDSSAGKAGITPKGILSIGTNVVSFTMTVATLYNLVSDYSSVAETGSSRYEYKEAAREKFKEDDPRKYEASWSSTGAWMHSNALIAPGEVEGARHENDRLVRLAREKANALSVAIVTDVEKLFALLPTERLRFRRRLEDEILALTQSRNPDRTIDLFKTLAGLGIDVSAQTKVIADLLAEKSVISVSAANAFVPRARKILAVVDRAMLALANEAVEGAEAAEKSAKKKISRAAPNPLMDRYLLNAQNAEHFLRQVRAHAALMPLEAAPAEESPPAEGSESAEE